MKFIYKSIVRDFGGLYIAMPIGETPGHKYLVKLNREAAFLWSLFQTDITETEVVEKYCTEFKKEKREVKKEVGDFIDYMVRSNMMEGKNVK